MQRRHITTAAQLVGLPSGAMLAAYLILITFASCGPQPLPDQPPNGTPTPPPVEVPAQLLAAHNAYRAKQSLPPLAADTKLQAAAQNHADWMARRGRMAHQGIGDGSPWDRIARTGYAMTAGGENVAWNQQTVDAVMRAWIGSPGHRANITGRFAEVGAAVAYGPKKDPYWCTVFASPGRAAKGPLEAEPVEDSPAAASEGGLLIPPARTKGP
jgi:uncharacterized protein YkwD